MKNCILPLLFISLCTAAFSQEGDKKTGASKSKKLGEAFYLDLGGVLSSVRGNSDSYSGYLPGFSAGISTPAYVLRDNADIMAGIRYAMLGSKYTSSGYEPGGYTTTTHAKLRLNYLQLPLTLRLKSSKGFYGEAGLQPAILLSAKDKHNGESENIKEYYKGFDLGFIAGAGYQSAGHFGGGVRVVPGLTNINKGNDYYEKAKDRNMAISVHASYRL